MSHRFGRPIMAEPAPWLRGYTRVEGEWIVLDPSRAEQYRPLSEKGYLYDLAAVRRPTDAVAFGRKYGLLWHGPNATEYREKFADWEDVTIRLNYCLQLYLTLRRATDGDQEALSDLRKRFLPGLLPLFSEPIETADDLLGAGAQVLAWQVNEGLDSAQEMISPLFVEYHEGDLSGPLLRSRFSGTFGFTVQTPNLVALAYHELAMAITNRAPMSKCPVCGRFFVVKDARQEYCTPTCAGRARYRRWADKKKLEQGGINERSSS